jgi:hypothetical protein
MAWIWVRMWMYRASFQQSMLESGYSHQEAAEWFNFLFEEAERQGCAVRDDDPGHDRFYAYVSVNYFHAGSGW